jgi:hypothetical protein
LPEGVDTASHRGAPNLRPTLHVHARAAFDALPWPRTRRNPHGSGNLPPRLPTGNSNLSVRRRHSAHSSSIHVAPPRLGPPVPSELIQRHALTCGCHQDQRASGGHGIPSLLRPKLLPKSWVSTQRHRSGNCQQLAPLHGPNLLRQPSPIAPKFTRVHPRLIGAKKHVPLRPFEGRGCGEIGRHARLRIWCFGVGVRVPPPAPPSKPATRTLAHPRT